MNHILSNKRIVFIDVLRIMSIVAVIILHYTADLLTRTNDFNTTSWWVSNFFNSISRFAVPVFFMISGSMILRVEVKSYRQFFYKKVLPLIISLVTWSFIYAAYTQYFILKSSMGVYDFFVHFTYGLIFDRNYVHLWFLYAIIAIYITVPLISKLVKACSEKDLRYYLVLWFLLSVVYKFISDIVFRVTSEYINIPITNIPFFMGYLGYFILGYYLFNYTVSMKAKNLFFNLGLISLFITPVATYFSSLYNGVLDEMFYGNYSLTTFFMAIGTFIYFKERDTAISEKLNYKVKKIISSVSKASFSIYLIHLLVEILVSRRAEIEATLIQSTSSLIFNVAIIFSISYITVKLLNLNKYITHVLFGGRS
ncbi:surface polysaccharide O-acyltransferase-like enzyme [Paenibacillus anaericanus]|uniref:acyltransferase n=1 Tax=Paenibacillus anaericanus TaxID=170367 RepID=UPI00277DDA91|nr:acyltransferase family protein [Paenibacillus anaericanus]MDQ0088535.1 surface polysaccharide O-acyltransferase-like enzyme [Paenibacillus anaericanus]